MCRIWRPPRNSIFVRSKLLLQVISLRQTFTLRIDVYALRDLMGHCYVHFAFLFTLSSSLDAMMILVLCQNVLGRVGTRPSSTGTSWYHVESIPGRYGIGPSRYQADMVSGRVGTRPMCYWAELVPGRCVIEPSWYQADVLLGRVVPGRGGIGPSWYQAEVVSGRVGTRPRRY